MTTLKTINDYKNRQVFFINNISFVSHINFKHERDDSEFSIITYAMALT